MTVKITFPVDALVSYHYYREDKDMAPLAATGRLRLIGDSGAFSALTQGARIDLAEYATWVARWREHLFWAAALDVIGDPHATHRNWLVLRDRYGLSTVPTLHAGGGTSWLDVYAAEGVDLVGLGGLVGKAAAAFRWAVHIFRYARAKYPEMRFHLWGVAATQYLDALPTYSADSSGAVLGELYRYARLRLFDPRSGQHHRVRLKGGTQVFALGRLLRDVYGVDPAEIRTSHAGNRQMLVQLAAASTQQYSAWLQRRHRVTAPRMVNPSSAGGTRVHLVSAGGRKQGSDDLLSVAGGTAMGTRLHVVDATPEHLAYLTKEQQ